MAETYTLNFILMKKSSFHNIDNDHHISGHDYSCGACYEICPFLCVCVCVRVTPPILVLKIRLHCVQSWLYLTLLNLLCAVA